MFFIWWSNTDDGYKDVCSEYSYCKICSSQTKNTFRLYQSKLKAYSIIPIYTSRTIKVICHNCLHERKLEKGLQKQMLEKFKKMNLS